MLRSYLLMVVLLAAAVAGCGTDPLPPIPTDGGADAAVAIDLNPGDLRPPPPEFGLPDLPPPPDFTAVDLTMFDLVVVPDLDMALPPDLVVPPDFVLPPDFVVLPDLVKPADLVPAPDMAQQQFKPGVASLIGMGAGPYFIAARDLNADKNADVAVVDLTSGQLAILLGKGDGTLGAPNLVSIGANSQPKSVAFGDFNADNKVDLAVANAFGVTTLLGDGAGGFALKVTIAAGVRPRGVAVADFNADGKADVLVANNGSNNVQVFQGDGTGALAMPIAFSVGGLPFGVVLGDFNGDGKPDAAVNCGNDNLGGAVGVVAVLLNNGPVMMNTSFAAATFNNVGINPLFAIGAADFNADAVVDLVSASNTDKTLSYLKALGAGKFAPQAVTANIGSAPNALDIADFNLDGKPDVIVANAANTDVGLLYGAGDGTFPLVVRYTAGMSPQGVVAVDLNNDKKPDAVVANFASHDITVLINNF